MGDGADAPRDTCAKRERGRSANLQGSSGVELGCFGHGNRVVMGKWTSAGRESLCGLQSKGLRGK